MKRDKIIVNDRQLACARIASPEGQDYLKGMAAAGNYAWADEKGPWALPRASQEAYCSLCGQWSLPACCLVLSQFEEDNSGSASQLGEAMVSKTGCVGVLFSID